MKIIATVPAKNEAPFIGTTLRALMMWVDEAMVLDHASDDETPEILRQIVIEFPGRVHVFKEPNPIWEEMRHRQFLLERAREYGATHIAIVDADEILTGNLLGSIRDVFEHMPSGRILQLPWVCLARSLDRYYASGIWYHNWVSSGFEDSPSAHWAARAGYDFHHRHPMGRPCVPHKPVTQELSNHQGGLMHLQFVDERRLRAKQALYKMTEVIRWSGREPVAAVDKRYNPAVYESDPERIATASVPEEWWKPYSPIAFEVGGKPWQEAECQRLWGWHGPAKFAGLDLFGVVG